MKTNTPVGIVFWLALSRSLQAQPDASVLNIDRTSLGVQLAWSGAAVLQAAPEVSGSWADVAGTVASATLPATDAQGFFRLRLPAFPINDTGQTNCYNTNGFVITPPLPGQPLHGQDAQHVTQPMRFRDNGDGTVSDLGTGLMWQKTPGSKVTWSNAVAGAGSFNVAGYTDWRLPSLKELYSLIDFTGVTGTSVADAKPYLDTNYFGFSYGNTSAGERYIDAQFWSATEYVGTTMGGDATVFGVNFADGRIKGYPKLKPSGAANTQFVRYLRGNPGYGINHFVANGDGTVTDLATGLMWQQADSGTALNCPQALAYAEDLTLAGHTDWRLPDAKELQGLVDYTRAPAVTGTAAINTNFFQVTTNESWYWTSTTHLDGPAGRRGDYAVYVCFGRAFGYMETPPGSGNYLLLDVHGAGAQRSDPKTGDPADYPHGFGPQGDQIRIYNYVRCVRGGLR